MNLNNLLCKYFKDSDEQYVTATGLIQYLVIYLVIFLAAIFTLVSIVITVLHLVTGQYYKSTSGWVAVAEAFGSLALAVILFTLGAFAWEWLSTIKLAECPLKREEKP